MKYLLGAAALLFVMTLSASLAVYVFSGILMFAGLVALVESIPPLKWFFSKTAAIIDIMIFALSVVAIQQMGVTVAIGLSVAGLLFSVFYKPMLRKAAVKKQEQKMKDRGMEAREIWSKR